MQSSTQRALAAIMLTDAVSFSARMSVDEEGTLALIQRDLDLISQLCDRYQGQVLKSTGDGLLMSFSSAVQAVNCGQEVQKQLSQLAEGLAPEEYLLHRIGIHLGDVLFSHGDVLGNGVNIAARLQTQSAPGGICISQTVYDVVKARLHFNATYLGPLHLKNIQEPVPAFQIPPFGQSVTMVMQPTVEASTDPHSLTAIAATLQEHPQSRRIQKLVYAASQGTWENNPTVLSRLELPDLLEKLYRRYPSVKSLQVAFQDIASRLNRKAEYLKVAAVVLEALTPAYANGPQTTLEAAEQTSLSSGQEGYRAIAAELSSHPEQLRIKKLLYAVIHKTWENDPAVLTQHSMDALVSDVHQIAPTEADLNQQLESIISRLNRQARYTQLALLISDLFHRLYGANTQTILASPDVTTLAATSIEVTCMMDRDSGGEPQGAPHETHLANATQVVGDAAIAPMGDTAPKDAVAAAPNKPRNRANLFGLRLEIMRYTSPLRAKILLLSTVRSPFSFSHQDWITLKSKTLDDLIQDTFNYCKTYADLESKLTIMCHCVDSVAENQQVAGAILQAMKPFYP